MAYLPTKPTVEPAASWRVTLPGSGQLQLERTSDGRCRLYLGKIRVARAVLLDVDNAGAYISHLYVKKSHRRQGFGRRLVTAILQIAQQMACEGISLHVQVGNAPAIALYRRVGFFICGVVRENGSEEGDFYAMAQRLQR